MMKWNEAPSGLSSRADSTSGVYPAYLVQAAVSETLTSGEDSDLDVALEVSMAPESRDGVGMSVLPKRISVLRERADWSDGVLPGIEKELTGLRDKGVYEVIPCPAGRESEVIPTFRIDCIKGDGRHKSRFVVLGNRTLGHGVHYTETATSMATQTAVKMITSFAAGCGYGLYSIDFEQAFLNADAGQDDLLIQLPELPLELQDKGLGPGKGAYSPDGKKLVGRLKKALYGLKDAPRLWQQHLLKRLGSADIGVEFLVTDRNVFRFHWHGQTLIGAIHVDDILFAPSSSDIKSEFLRRVRNEFAVTGGDTPVEKFCGFQFRYDNDNRSITIHQENFERLMIAKYGALGAKSWEAPMLVSSVDRAASLLPWAGVSSPHDQINFMMFIGDLHWATRTNPRLAFCATALSSFVQNPGPPHVKAARRVLEHMAGTLGQGVTYHGSAKIVDSVYPHRNKLIGATDADFSHEGFKSISGITVMMNGGAIVHSARRQSSVSMTSTEAEVKAAGLLAQTLEYVVSLWSELAGSRHESVRCIMDNQTAIKHVSKGADAPAAAPYLRHKRMVEEKVYRGLMWFDFLHGKENIADILTKQVRSLPEFKIKDGVISGKEPRIFETENVSRILLKRR